MRSTLALLFSIVSLVLLAVLWRHEGDANPLTVEKHQHHAMKLSSGTGKPVTYVPSKGTTYRIAPKTFTVPQIGHGAHTLQAGAWYVHGIYLRDTGVDVSGLFNYWGDKYGVAPYGLAAVGGTESGWHQYADRYGVWPDVSFGLMQFTVSTASQYGVCSDTMSCKAWLDVPANAVYLAARFFSTIKQLTCLDFPTAYVAYNMGPGYGCGASIYYFPGGMAYTNYHNNFLPNYYYVLANYLGGAPTPPPPPPPPAPKKVVPFPLKAWRAYTHAHHHHRITTRWHGKRGWIPFVWWSHRAECGGVVSARQWHPKGVGGRNGFMHQRFQRCAITLWPRHPHYHPKVTAAPSLK